MATHGSVGEAGASWAFRDGEWYSKYMSEQIAVRVPEEDLRGLDEVVARGRYPSRAAAVRAALGMLLREERNRWIAEEYRRAYAEHPSDLEFAEAAAHAMGEIIVERERTERR